LIKLPNQHIGMISEASRDTEDWWKFSHRRNKLHFKHVKL